LLKVPFLLVLFFGQAKKKNIMSYRAKSNEVERSLFYVIARSFDL
jgi:hypothetical protein